MFYWLHVPLSLPAERVEHTSRRHLLHTGRARSDVEEIDAVAVDIVCVCSRVSQVIFKHITMRVGRANSHVGGSNITLILRSENPQSSTGRLLETIVR